MLPAHCRMANMMNTTPIGNLMLRDVHLRLQTGIYFRPVGYYCGFLLKTGTPGYFGAKNRYVLKPSTLFHFAI